MMPTVSLANLATYSMQVAAVITIGAGTLWALRLQSPRPRLVCLRAILLACFALPLLAPVTRLPASAALPPVTVQISAGDIDTTVVGRPSAPVAGRGFSRGKTAPASTRLAEASSLLVSVLPFALLVGVLARLSWLVVGLAALGRLRRGAVLLVSVNDGVARRSMLGRPRSADADSCAARAIGDAADLVRARAAFLTSQAVTRPVTFGVIRPVVLLPPTFAALDETEKAAIATHELLHVKRGDWLQTIGEELLRALFWFHPAVWWLLGQIDLGREQVVDQEVVRLTERREQYVNALVRLALVPAGPVLRPASLFLGRAHLVKRVALLSREVRMSRWRLAVSVVLVAAALVFGGHLVLEALPLTGVAGGDMRVPPSRLASAPPAPSSSAGTLGSDRAASDVPSEALAAERAPVVQDTPRPSSFAPRVLQSVPPNLAPGNVEPGKDAIVTLAGTVDSTGVVSGAVSLLADNGRAQAAASSPAAADRIIDERMIPAPIAARMHAALDALRTWRFEAPPAPASVYVGFNFAADQTASFEPIRVGGSVRQPVRVKDVRPVYPEEAQNRGIQGVVILEMLIDGNTGIPAQAVALRPVGPLTLPALEAALQWRFAPTPEYPRVLMTVTVNFTLAGGVAGGISGGVQGGVAGGVEGGVAGGLAGGVSGGIAGGTQLSIPAGWPAPIRVGGNIKAPTKILDVRPVYPPIAQNARVQGVVIVEVLIGPDGKIADVRILRSIPLLDQAALDAVRQWQFTPTLLNGTPVPVIMTCTVNFTLDGDDQPREVTPGRVTYSQRQLMPNGTVSEVSATVPAGGATRPGPGVTMPRVLHNVKPAYTPEAMQDKVQGNVVVEGVVEIDGTVGDVRILKGLDARLDEQALIAARQWRFEPGMKNGVAVPVVVTMEMTFTLR